MPFTAIADVAKVELLFTYEGHTGVNVVHVQEGATPTPGLMAAISAAAIAAYDSHVLPAKSAAFRLDAVRVTDLTSATGPVNETPDGVSGTGSSDGSNAALAAVVRLLTDLRGRSHRGRIYDSGYPRLYFLPDGSIDPTGREGIFENWLAWRNDMSTAGFPMVVASNTLASFDAVSDLTVAPVVGVQRRRLRD
jgi:hypothetical protein